MNTNLINGQLAATSKLDMVQLMYNPNTMKVVFVGDPTGFEQIIGQYGMILASALAPNYHAMEADINGDLQRFSDKYAEQLRQDTSLAYFATIIAALNQGKNILLFFPESASGLSYPNMLLTIIQMWFGIQTGTETTKFSYDPNFTPQNLDLLYQFSIIGPAMYLVMSGENFHMIDKLLYDLGIPTSPNSNPYSVYKYLNEYRLSMIDADTLLVKPFTREI